MTAESIPARREQGWRAVPLRSVAVAVALLLAGLAITVEAQRDYRIEKINQATAQAEVLASTVTAVLAFDDRPGAEEMLAGLRANPEIEEAALYGADDKRFADFSRSGERLFPERIEEGSFAPAISTDQVTVGADAMQAKRRLGRLYIRAQLEPASRTWRRYAGIALLGMMAAIVVIAQTLAQGALRRANAQLGAQAGELAAANRALEAQIAERERAEAALRQAQKIEAIGQLTGGIAHDFNNLLHAVIASIEAVGRRLDRAELSHQMNADIRKYLDIALQGARRGASLTQRMLAFARKQPLAPTVIDPNKLVSGLSELLRRTLGEQVALECVLGGGLWRISADANQLESALLNLAVNARDAMPEGGKLTIETANAHLSDAYVATLDEVKAGQYVVIAVSDTGDGMTPAVAAKAFDPFFTTKEIGKGTGLGLSQVYGFVKQSGGHVKIYSEPGEGTAVKLYLPRVMDREVESEAAEVQGIASGGAERILVVEDEPEVREATTTMLRELGYHVIEAADAAAALKLLESDAEIDLLFTDIVLPGGTNGRQLAERASLDRASLKVLYTTGYTKNAIVHQGRLDPGVQLIEKPFTYQALARKIRQVLD